MGNTANCLFLQNKTLYMRSVSSFVQRVVCCKDEILELEQKPLTEYIKQRWSSISRPYCQETASSHSPQNTWHDEQCS